jgi:hypothetical protein
MNPNFGTEGLECELTTSSLEEIKNLLINEGLAKLSNEELVNKIIEVSKKPSDRPSPGPKPPPPPTPTPSPKPGGGPKKPRK